MSADPMERHSSSRGGFLWHGNSTLFSPQFLYVSQNDHPPARALAQVPQNSVSVCLPLALCLPFLFCLFSFMFTIIRGIPLFSYQCAPRNTHTHAAQTPQTTPHKQHSQRTTDHKKTHTHTANRTPHTTNDAHRSSSKFAQDLFAQNLYVFFILVLTRGRRTSGRWRQRAAELGARRCVQWLQLLSFSK